MVCSYTCRRTPGELHPPRAMMYFSGVLSATIMEAAVCPYGIIRTNRKTLAVQGVDWFVLILFPPDPLQKIGATREAKKRGVT